MLTNEGAITSTPGRGTFVRVRLMATYHASWAEQRERMGQAGRRRVEACFSLERQVARMSAIYREAASIG